jgi:hypothetical protein
VAVVLVVIAILFGLLVLLLAVPVDVAFRFEGIEAFKGQLAIRWLFGLLRFRIHLPGAAQPRPPQPKAKPEAAKVRVKPKERGGRPRILAVLRQAAFRRRAYRLVKDLVRATHPQQLRLRMRLGLGDPADTGRLWAFVGPLNALAQNLRNAEVRIEPEFMDPVFEFEAHGRFRLIPLQFLALAIAFALSPPSIRAWRTLRGSHA